MSDIEQIRTELRNEFCANIHGYFLDNDLGPAESDDFIRSNTILIDNSVNIMIDDYTRDNELDDLPNRSGDWVREYMEEIFEAMDEYFGER